MSVKNGTIKNVYSNICPLGCIQILCFSWLPYVPTGDNENKPPGNVISLLVLTTVDKRRNSFNSLLVILAIADSVFLVFYVFDSSYVNALQNDEPEWWGIEVAWRSSGLRSCAINQYFCQSDPDRVKCIWTRFSSRNSCPLINTFLNQALFESFFCLIGTPAATPVWSTPWRRWSWLRVSTWSSR